jgi:hypothetical protein
MADLIRPAQVEDEKAALTTFLSAHLSREADEARFDWLYCKNPFGKARVWVVCESETGKIIGLSAAFPRQVTSAGKNAPGYVFGDFCIHPDYRSLGPALALQRTTLEDLSNEGSGFVFDFPSNSMLAIYKRLRIETSTSMIRYAKSLRADRQIQRRIPSPLAARGLSAAANVALRVRDAGLKRSSTWTIAEQTELCGEEFTQAAQPWSARFGICPVRTADYLNWRFLQHPQRRYHLLTARKGGELCGFLIYYLDAEDAVIVDLLAEADAALKALLVEAIEIARSHRVQTLSVPFLPSQAGKNLLEDCGFEPRESSPAILLNLPWSAKDGKGPDANRWYLTHGDRES